MRTVWSVLRIGRTAVSLAARWGRSLAGRSFACGGLASLITVALIHQVHARFGGGLPMAFSVLFTLAVALAVGVWFGSRRKAGARWTSISAAVLIAIWSISFPQLCDAAAFVLRSIDLETL